jgi:hypothetical protein
MTLPYPDSPEIDENIGTSIPRIKDNLEYLDSLIGSGNVKTIVSTNVEMSTKFGTEIITGVGFQPRAMLTFGSYIGSHMNSWGGATEASAGTSSVSIDCHCVGQNETYAGVASSLSFLQIYQTADTYIAGSVSNFNSDGAVLNWTKGGTPVSTAVNILYLFFG